MHLALPNDHHSPAEGLQFQKVLLIADFVAMELRRPILGVRPGQLPPCRAVVPVPEAAMHEYDLPLPWEDDIRVARKIFPVQTVSETMSEQDRTHGQLWLGFYLSNSCHPLRQR